jgi:hypothetical protein
MSAAPVLAALGCKAPAGGDRLEQALEAAPAEASGRRVAAALAVAVACAVALALLASAPDETRWPLAPWTAADMLSLSSSAPALGGQHESAPPEPASVEPSLAPAKLVESEESALAAFAGAIQCVAPQSSSVLLDPCLSPKGPLDSQQCRCRFVGAARRMTYVIARPTAAPPLSDAQVRDSLVVAFVHVNKAGGQTIKHSLFDAAQHGHWAVAPLGTFQSFGTLWGVLEGVGAGTGRARAPALASAPTPAPALDPSSKTTLPPAFRALAPRGAVRLRLRLRLRLLGSRNASAPPLRVVYGALSMGLCELFAPRPCVYIVNVREPVSRAISDYNYFCVRGAENQRKWLPEWKRRGRCQVGLVEYLESRMGTESLVERVTRGCDSGCGVAAAKANLDHPCVRTVVLEHMAEDLGRLSRLLSEGALAASLKALVHDGTHANATPLSSRAERESRDPNVLARVRQLLKDDIQVYDHALASRDAKWAQSLTSCNAL